MFGQFPFASMISKEKPRPTYRCNCTILRKCLTQRHSLPYVVRNLRALRTNHAIVEFSPRHIHIFHLSQETYQLRNAHIHVRSFFEPMSIFHCLAILESILFLAAYISVQKINQNFHAWGPINILGAGATAIFNPW